MQATLDENTIARILPGGWTIAATNLPVWLGGERSRSHFSFEMISQGPLVLSEDVSYLDAEGEEKHIVGTDTWDWEEFRWRGTGLQRFAGARWSVNGVSADGAIAVIRYSKSRATPSGINILVRDGAQVMELRATIARGTEQFGLSPEDFGSLTWLVPATAW